MPALRDLPWQITSCNSTRISNLALSRPGSLAFHRVGAATTSSTSPKSRTPPWPQAGAQNGKWIKAHLGWVDAAVRLLRFLPTLPLFSHVWEAFLRRLQIEDEPHLVEWLRTFERPLPAALHARFGQLDPLHSSSLCSMWGGRDGCVPGSGSGNQPAEALHAPWQTRLKALDGKGNIPHVLAVTQKLYSEHWASWCDWDNDTPVHFQNQVRNSQSLLHAFSIFSSSCIH